MKKLYFLILISASLLWSCSRSGNVPELRVGLVNFVAGTVLLSGPSGKEIAAKPGDAVADTMSIRTVGEGSMCELYFDNTAVKIQGSSTLAMGAIFYGKGLSENTNLILKQGQSFVNAPKLLKGSAFRVKTSTSVAAVRGTEFYVIEGTLSTISCLSGKVAVAVKGQTEMDAPVISPNEEIVTSRSGTAEKRMISDSRRDRFASQRATTPLTVKNAETFEKIRECDKETISRLKNEIAAFITPKALSYATSHSAKEKQEASIGAQETEVKEIQSEAAAEKPAVDTIPEHSVPETIPAAAPVKHQETVASAPSIKTSGPKYPIDTTVRQQKKSSSGGQTTPPFESSLPYFLE
jgi:hypothetical protein